MKDRGPTELLRRRAPAPDSLRQRCWNVMALMKGIFTVDDLLIAAHRGVATDRTRESLHRWCDALARAGFLTRLKLRAPSTRKGQRGVSQWRVQRHTGEFAPIHREDRRTVFDPNLTVEVAI